MTTISQRSDVQPKMMTVCMFSLDGDDLEHNLTLPSTTTVKQLKEKWATRHQVDLNLIRISSGDGTTLLHDDATLSDITPTGNVGRIVEVLVERGFQPTVRGPADGGPSSAKVTCWLSSTGGDLEADCRRALGCAATQPLRLLADNQPLEAVSRLRDQNVGPRSELTLEPFRNVHLLVTSTDHEERKMTPCLPADTRLTKVKGLWSEKYGVPVGRFELFLPGGGTVAEDITVADVASTDPQEGGLSALLRVREQTRVFVRQYKQEEQKEMLVFLSSTPAEVRGQCCEALGVDGERPARLLVGSRRLQMDKRLEVQEVRPGTVLDLDLRFELALSVGGKVHTRCVFASDLASVLDVVPGGGQLRLMRAGRVLPLDADISAALAPLWGQYRQQLSLEVSRSIYVTHETGIERREVWSDSLVDCRRSRQPRLPPAVVDEGTLGSSSPPRGRVAPDGLLHLALLAVTVLLTSGRRLLLRLPRYALVSDLLAAVRARESERHVHLYRGEHRLDESARVEEMGAGEVRAEVQPLLRVTMHVERQEVQFESELESTRHTCLRRHLVQALDRDLRKDIVLTCRGCGRRLTRRQEEHQSVPAACCEKHSLELDVNLHPGQREVASQERADRTNDKSVAVPPSEVSVSSQCFPTVDGEEIEIVATIFSEDLDSNSHKMTVSANDSRTSLLRKVGGMMTNQQKSLNLVWQMGGYFERKEKEQHGMLVSKSYVASVEKLYENVAFTAITWTLVSEDLDMWFPSKEITNDIATRGYNENLTPSIYAAYYCRMTTDSRGNLMELPGDIFDILDFTVMLLGQRVSDKRSTYESKVLFETVDGCYVVFPSGEEVTDVSTCLALCSIPADVIRRDLMLLLLKDASHLPKLRLRRGRYLNILTLDGVEHDIEDGTVRLKTMSSPGRRWIARIAETTKFLKALCEALWNPEIIENKSFTNIENSVGRKKQR